MNDDIMTSTSTTNDTEWSKNCCWPSQIEYLLMMLLLVLLWSGGSSAVTTTMILWAMRMMISMPLSIALCTQHSLFSTQCSSKLKLSAGLSLLYSSYPWTHGIALTHSYSYGTLSSVLISQQLPRSSASCWWWTPHVMTSTVSYYIHHHTNTVWWFVSSTFILVISGVSSISRRVESRGEGGEIVRAEQNASAYVSRY